VEETTTEVSVSDDDERDSKKEILLLEDIINNLLKNYVANPPTLTLLLDKTPEKGTTDSVQFVRQAIQENLKNENLAKSVTSATIVDDGCLFDVNSALNKFKIIELSKKLKKTDIIMDYDIANNILVDTDLIRLDDDEH
jgi:hypothetical protein